MLDMTNFIEKLNIQLQGGLELIENGQAICSRKEDIVHLLEILKLEYNYWLLADITAVDFNDFYEVVYHLLNDEEKLLAVKVKLDKSGSIIPTITSLWKAAETQEREIFDLMGIEFQGHGNLTRILCPDDFVGHPLQKSFKLNKVSRF